MQATNEKQEKREQLLLANPMEIASIVRNQTLVVQAELSAAGSGDDTTHPLKVYSRYSRFVFAIINADKKSATANIRVTDMPGVLAASEYAYRTHMDALYKPSLAASAVDENGVDTSSPAFTKRFTSGNMKGKTPVEVLLAAEDKEATIADFKKQYMWLKENAQKNPRYAAGNQEQMEAINQAVHLFRDGKLKDGMQAASSAMGVSVPIYASGFRPLRSRAQRNGKTFIYEVNISWSLGSDYPVTVEIRNYYAEVVEKDNGMLNVLVKTKEAEQKNSMALSAAEWQNVMYMASANMRLFEERCRDACFNAAGNAKRRSREAAGIA